MALIKSISGIRGTIGGKTGNNLTPLDTVKFTAAYGTWLKEQKKDKKKLKVVVGRDARISGRMVHGLVLSTLQGLGIDVVDLGLSTTPTVEVTVISEKADGGIIITASHNPRQWNALKLLNEKGEFLNAAEGETVLKLAEKDQYDFVSVDDLGVITPKINALEKHIDQVMALELVDRKKIASKKYRVVVDAVNSTGGIAIPELLRALGVTDVIKLNCQPTGQFAHNPEPLKENLTEVCRVVVQEKADMGIVVDPDVDRLAFIDEKGEMFGEEYTLVAVADYILGKKKGNTVSNLSSSRALKDITEKHGGHYDAAAVGEVNVVAKMKENRAVIGGEGNGGVIYPELHYGRDALVGVALFLTYLAQTDKKMSELRADLPAYFMSKSKVELTPQIDVDAILEKMAQKYKEEKITTIDGVKIDFADSWAHLRKSNTEPIIRIYTEAKTQEKADRLAAEIYSVVRSLA